MCKPERTQENPKVRPAKHAHSNTSILQIKRTEKNKNNTKKLQNTRQGLPHAKYKRKTKKGEQKSARMMKQYSRNQSKKKYNGNSGTSCVHKNATDKEKT